MYTTSKMLLVVSALALAGTVAVQAQGVNGTINATAQVQAPITVAGTQPLAFGTVFPGVAKTVAYSDAANAGKFSVTGQAGQTVTYSFTLPANLASGPNNLPIGSWTGYVNTTNTVAGGAAITPSATPATAVLSNGGTGNLFYFVGATVTPPANLPAGAYTATVTLTVSY
jgi:hypothetical protein